MVNKISIVISKNPDGYTVIFPDFKREVIDCRDSSLDGVLNCIKEALETHLISSDISHEEETTGESILKMVDKLTMDFTGEELSRLPSDGAEEHDHYLYGTHKRRE